MLIVLLDHSGSMGEPFSGTSDPLSRRVRVADAEIKLAAAKEVLLEEIEQLDDRVELAVFAFTETVQLAFSGTGGQQNAIRAALDRISAEDGTDIAAALTAAAEHKKQSGSSVATTIILISDGKSDRQAAMLAAARCSELGMGIHFILMDPTDEGKVFLRDVIGRVGGTSITVTSHSQLKESTRGARTAYALAQARADRFLNQAEEELQQVAREAQGKEPLQFTAGYPGQILPTESYPLLVYVHLHQMKDEVGRRLAAAGPQLGAYPRSSDTAPANRLIPIGTQLDVTPRISNVQVTPPQQRVTWLGEIEELTFRIRYSQIETPENLCSGFIDISINGLVIARIPISISVEAKREELRLERATAEMISRIFASYSRQDLPVVRACKAAYRALGIQLFIDKEEILPGMPWEDVIRQSIANNDLFQLFWSKASANSDYVAKEWDLALKVVAQRSRDFIRPVYWSEPMVRPPSPLAHINFGFLDLRALNVPAGRAGDAASAEPQATWAGTAANLKILPVAQSEEGDVAHLRQALSRAVPFLEHLIGVRYYPPVTFVVDAHTVQSVRSVLDLTGDDSTSPTGNDSTPLTDHMLNVLQSLALAFHVGKLSEGDSSEAREQFREVNDRPQEQAEFRHLVRMAKLDFCPFCRAILRRPDGPAGRP